MLAPPEAIPPQRPAGSPALDRQDAGEWWVLHTKSNLEWQLATDLLRLGIDYYLPQSESVARARGGGRAVSRLPLFKNYLFLRGDEFAPGKALATLKVRNVIRVVNQPRIRRDLLNLSHAIEINPRIEQCDFAVTGRRVRITCGVFEGVEGVVVSRGKFDLLVVEVESCGKAVMELPTSKLEAA
jgi:transcription antitermination factor NusG